MQGPSLSVDTACSSSLVVAHLAATSFLPGGCRRALAAGVNLTVRAETTAVLSKAGMLAVDGRCKTLDAAADGYMRGEACVAHLLEAATSGDLSPRGAMEAAVLLGTPVNQDGRSSSLTAPNGPSQQAVIRAALERAGVPALDIGTLEMHGTGTALGDPIEVGAAFVMLQVRGPSCRVHLAVCYPVIYQLALGRGMRVQSECCCYAVFFTGFWSCSPGASRRQVALASC